MQVDIFYPYRNKDFTLGNPNSIYNTIGSQIATNLQMTFVLSTLVFSKRTLSTKIEMNTVI